jgi:hypothetical protein
MEPREINNILTIPAEDSASPIKSNEAEFIYDFLKEKGLSKTLETGFAYAKSASHIMAATGSKHIAIDPFQDNYQNLGIKNTRDLGLDKYLELHEDYSHNVLPKLVDQKEKFEFIFIDGDHKFDGIFIDFYYADLLLEKDGYVLLHDTWMRSTQLLISFIKKNRKDYIHQPTPCRNLMMFQKVSDDERDGMFFKDFYTLKATFSHRLIIWMTTGKRSGLKRIFFYFKEKMK